MSAFQRKDRLRRLTVCALFAALVCVLSPIAIPIGPIPVSLGLLGVLLCAVCLRPLMSATAVSVYVAIGLCGLPVFGGAMGGAPALAGPTGGYLWSYLILAPVVSLLCGKSERKSRQPSVTQAFFACTVGMLICYLCGTAQYAMITKTPIIAALTVCVLPFLPIDLAKALFAATVGRRLWALVSRHV